MATTYTPVLENAIADFEAATGNTGFVRQMCDLAYLQGKRDEIRAINCLSNDTLPDCYRDGNIPETFTTEVI